MAHRKLPSGLWDCQTFQSRKSTIDQAYLSNPDRGSYTGVASRIPICLAVRSVVSQLMVKRTQGNEY